MRTPSPIVLALFGLIAAAPAPAPITDDFVSYIQTSRNNSDFGLRDGKFYPYSTVRGWRIGYRQTVADKKWFRAGWPQAEAEKALRAELDATLAAARAWALKNKVEPFDQWSQASREIFLDLAHTEGLLEEADPEPPDRAGKGGGRRGGVLRARSAGRRHRNRRSCRRPRWQRRRRRSRLRDRRRAARRHATERGRTWAVASRLPRAIRRAKSVIGRSTSRWTTTPTTRQIAVSAAWDHSM